MATGFGIVGDTWLHPYGYLLTNRRSPTNKVGIIEIEGM